MTQEKGLSVRAYARHRGVSHTAVQRAIARRRLDRCLGRSPSGAVRIMDVGLADQEWDANVDLTRAPAAIKQREADRQRGTVPTVPQPVPGNGSDEDDALGSVPLGALTLSEATAQEKAWKARLAELAYREKSGVLVDAREVEHRTVDTFMKCRTKLLGVPSKLKTRLPHLTRADLLAIAEEIRQACEELAVEPVSDPAAEGAA